MLSQVSIWVRIINVKIWFRGIGQEKIGGQDVGVYLMMILRFMWYRYNHTFEYKGLLLSVSTGISIEYSFCHLLWDSNYIYIYIYMYMYNTY